MTWERFGEKRMSRRGFLAAAGALTALSASCGGGGGKPPPLPTHPEETADLPTRVGETPTRPAGVQAGGVLRYTGFVQDDGIFDPHKTQAAPFFGLQAMLFSRLLAYHDMSEGESTIYADLAETKPEQPDEQTVIFKLKQGAIWHEREPLNGRAVTADDVKFSVERQRDGDASFIRAAKWQNIETIEVQDDATVRLKLKAPQAALLHLFADVNSFIVAPELTANGREITLADQVGSGPFRFVEWNRDQFASVTRNPGWYGGEGRPYLDSITVVQPRDAAEVEAGLRTKQLDVAFVGRPTAERLKKVIPTLNERPMGTSLFFGMRFFLPQDPYSDARFRTAVSVALDRRAMIQEFFSGSGDMNPWISWPVKRWTLPQAELSGIAGYRPGDGGRAQDIADARAMLAAVEKPIPDDIPLFVLDEAERSLGMGTLISRQLQETLGLNVTVYPMQLGELVRRLISGEAPWAAAPDTGWIDLDDWVHPYFHSQGTKNTFPLRDPDMDALVDAQRIELDEAKRREIGLEIQRKLLDLNVAVNFVSERVIALARSYVRNFPLDIGDGYQQLLADCWLDPSDPDFRGR